jgi:hypothetical protein
MQTHMPLAASIANELRYLGQPDSVLPWSMGSCSEWSAEISQQCLTCRLVSAQLCMSTGAIVTTVLWHFCNRNAGMLYPSCTKARAELYVKRPGSTRRAPLPTKYLLGQIQYIIHSRTHPFAYLSIGQIIRSPGLATSAAALSFVAAWNSTKNTSTLNSLHSQSRVFGTRIRVALPARESGAQSAS